MKSKAILPPPRYFSSVDIYCRKRWRRVPHIANGYWSRWRKEFLRILQKRKICKTQKRNFQNGHIIMLKAQCHRNHWPVAYIIEAFADKQINMVLFEKSDWNLEVKKNAQRELIRPITKIVLLVEHDSPTESQGVNHN